MEIDLAAHQVLQVAIPRAAGTSVPCRCCTSSWWAIDTAPLSLANAFERPVTPAAAGGYIEPSVTALASHWTQQRAAWGDAGIRGTLVFSPLDEAVLGGLAAHAVRPYDAFIEAVVTLATGEA